eukprot:scaffold76178_cov18-Tisochrysis_lutea.AAC.1
MAAAMSLPYPIEAAVPLSPPRHRFQHWALRASLGDVNESTINGLCGWRNSTRLGVSSRGLPELRDRSGGPCAFVASGA